MNEKMRSPRSSSMRSYSRSFELPEDEVDLNEDPNITSGVMLPIFLNDLHCQDHHDDHEQDLVEVTLDIDDDNIIVRSVTPTRQQAPREAGADEDVALERNLSITARIRRKFPWIRSSSSRASSEAGEPAGGALSAREARKIRARLDRNCSSAQRALGGLRFMNETTTGANGNEEVWRKVEERFRCLAKDGLLAREDFGECIGKKPTFHELLPYILSASSSIMQSTSSLPLLSSPPSDQSQNLNHQFYTIGTITLYLCMRKNLMSFRVHKRSRSQTRLTYFSI